MKKLILMLMLCAPMSLFAQKFGHLDSQALLQSLPEATNVQKELEAKGKEYEKQLTDMQAELQRKAEEYDKTKSTMNATKQAETEKSLQDMYAKIQQTAQDNQKAFNEQQQQKLGPVLDNRSCSKKRWLCLYNGERCRATIVHKRGCQQGYYSRG